MIQYQPQNQQQSLNPTNNIEKGDTTTEQSDKSQIYQPAKNNPKYFTPEKTNSRQFTKLDSFQQQPKSLSQKRSNTEPDQSNGSIQKDSINNLSQNANNYSASSSGMNSERGKQQKLKNQTGYNLVLKGNDMQSYINTQIQKKLAYCINGSNSKEIYPSKIVSSLKNGQNYQNAGNAFKLNPQTLLKRTEGDQLVGKAQSLEKGNQENSEYPRTQIIKPSNSRRRIYSLQKEEVDQSQQNLNSSMQNDTQQSLGGIMRANLQRNKNFQYSKINQSLEPKKLKELPLYNLKTRDTTQEQEQGSSIRSVLYKQQYQSQNKLNQIGRQDEDDNKYDRCQSEKRLKTDTSLQSDYTTQTCPQNRIKSPESIHSMISSISNKQKPFSKKIIEKIKMNRTIQNSNGSYYATSSTSFTDNSNFQQNLNSNLTHNMLVVQQAQRINKYAQYIKQDTYRANQELRPNKDKVKELVSSIIEMYQFLLTLSPDKLRIAQIMKNCGATKGRLIEIFFTSPQLNSSPAKEDLYYNRYLDTVEKTFSSYKNQEGINQIHIDNTLDDQSMFTDKTPQSIFNTELELVENLNAKHFYEKSYFKVLHKDTNGITNVAEYIDLQVIEDLDNLKTMLQICLKFTEDSSPKKKDRSRSPPVQVSPPNHSNHGNKDIQISQFDVKINKYEVNRQGIPIRNQIKQEDQQQQKIIQSNNNNNNEQNKKDSYNSMKKDDRKSEVAATNPEIQQYLDLYKDCRNERKGIVSEIREYSSINEGTKIPSYVSNPYTTQFNDFSMNVDFDIAKYL